MRSDKVARFSGSKRSLGSRIYRTTTLSRRTQCIQPRPTITPRVIAQKKAGGSCEAPAVARGLCFFHAHPEKLSELGRQGGQKNRRWQFDSSELSTVSLKSIDEVCKLLEETINRVRQGPFDLRAANTIGFLTGIFLKALDQRVEEPTAGHKQTENGPESPAHTKVEAEVLEHELMRLVLELDQDKHPAMKLEAIKAAYVVNGTLESKSTRRLSLSDNQNNEASADIYMMFNCSHVPASPALQEEVFDLFPAQSQDDDGVAPGPLPVLSIFARQIQLGF
jgi:hypothetical protein